MGDANWSGKKENQREMRQAWTLLPTMTGLWEDGYSPGSCQGGRLVVPAASSDTSQASPGQCSPVQRAQAVSASPLPYPSSLCSTPRVQRRAPSPPSS